MEKNNERAMNRTKRNMRTRRNLSRATDYYPQALLAFIVLAAILLLYFLLTKLPVIGAFIGKVNHALAPAFAGFIFAFIMSPLVRFVENRLIKFSLSRKNAKPDDPEWVAKIRRRCRSYGILLTLTFLLSIIVFLLILIIPQFLKSAAKLGDNLAGYLQQLRDYADDFLKKNPRLDEALRPVLDKAQDPAAIAESIKKTIKVESFFAAGNLIVGGLRLIVRVLYIWLVGTIVSVYLLKSKEYFIGLCKKIMFAILPKRASKNAVQTLHKANTIYTAAILGKLLDSLIIGLLCFVGTTIMGIWFPAIGEYSILVSVIVGVTNVIPFFGPFIGGVPCSILIFSMAPGQGLLFALFIVVLQQFDGNFLDPHIVGKKVGLRPLYVLCACMLGSGLFGVPGLLVATPTCALIYYLTKSYLEVRLESKNLPIETSDYVTIPGAVIANRSLGEDQMTERMVAESDALDAAQEAAIEQAEKAENIKNRRRRRHRSGSNVTGDDESGDIDLSAYDDLRSGLSREKRLEREWLMSGGEEDINNNGISDEREREHMEQANRKKEPRKSLMMRMIEEAEIDWNEHGNRPLSSSSGAKKPADGENEEAQNGDAVGAETAGEEPGPETDEASADGVETESEKTDDGE